MTVFTPLTDKDYEGLRRTLRSLQVNRSLTALSDVAVNKNVSPAVINAVPDIKPTKQNKTKQSVC